MAAPRPSTQSERNPPRIYVASLSDYNAGRLHGAWINAVNGDEVHEKISEMLEASPEGGAEEWAIHDSEGWGSYSVQEFDSIEFLCGVGAAIQSHGLIFAEYVSHTGRPTEADDLAQVIERFTESYQGAFETIEDWAEQFLEDTGALREVPDSLRPYVDLEKWAEDAEMNGDIFTIEDANHRTHVFWNR